MTEGGARFENLPAKKKNPQANPESIPPTRQGWERERDDGEANIDPHKAPFSPTPRMEMGEIVMTPTRHNEWRNDNEGHLTGNKLRFCEPHGDIG